MSDRVGAGSALVLWRRRILVDDVARLPVFVEADASGLPFRELDGERDGLGQLPPSASALRAVRFVDPMFELGRYGRDVRARVVRALATARWSSETRFCATCGEPLRWEDAGRVKVCANSSSPHRHFPRIDPATIVLVDDGARMLLGRQPGWPPGLYSTLAGFVEAGETAEEAVVREVFEESGVRVNAVRYFGSEPWPFPRSLMLGYFASATTTSLERGEELEDVRWFDATEGRRLLRSLEQSMPFGDTIARRLIAAWLDARE